MHVQQHERATGTASVQCSLDCRSWRFDRACDRMHPRAFLVCVSSLVPVVRFRANRVTVGDYGRHNASTGIAISKGHNNCVQGRMEGTTGDQLTRMQSYVYSTGAYLQHDPL